MIISAIWLPARSGRTSDFEIDVANLEDVDLTFRFRFTIAQAHGVGSAANAQLLEDGVKILAAFGFNPKAVNWTRDDLRYTTWIDIAFRAGEVRAHGLRAAGLFPGGPDNRSLLLHPDGVLRGYWELSLPAVTVPAGTAVSKPQLDRPARVLVTIVSRVHASTSDPNLVVPIVAANGQAEQLIAPDQPRRAVAGGAMVTKRKAATRRRR